MKYKRAVLLDTSFFLRFLNDGSPLFKNADGYFRYFLQNEIDMMISSISVAEYCIGGDLQELTIEKFTNCSFQLKPRSKSE